MTVQAGLCQTWSEPKLLCFFFTHRLNWNLITKEAPDLLVLQCIETINLEIDWLVVLILFELMLYVSVNSNGHVGTLPPFYGTFTQH